MSHWITLLAALSISEASADSDAFTKIYHGYVTKIRCQGRLLVSAVGDDRLVRLEPLPKDLGCSILLKPVAASGRTNLILETSTGTIERILEIQATKIAPSSGDLSISVKAGAQ